MDSAAWSGSARVGGPRAVSEQTSRAVSGRPSRASLRSASMGPGTPSGHLPSPERSQPAPAVHPATPGQSPKTPSRVAASGKNAPVGCSSPDDCRASGAFGRNAPGGVARLGNGVVAPVAAPARPSAGPSGRSPTAATGRSPATSSTQWWSPTSSATGRSCCTPGRATWPRRGGTSSRATGPGPARRSRPTPDGGQVRGAACA
jgi:hypothetical protein